MTEEQRKRVFKLRSQGLGYKTIAREVIESDILCKISGS